MARLETGVLRGFARGGSPRMTPDPKPTPQRTGAIAATWPTGSASRRRASSRRGATARQGSGSAWA